MQLSSVTLENGLLCVDGIAYHSRHAPEREAARFVAALPAHTQNATSFVLIAPGLPYIRHELIRSGAHTVVELHPPPFAAVDGFTGEPSRYFPSNGSDIRSIVQHHFDDYESLNLGIIVWPVGAKRFADFCTLCLNAIKEHVEQCRSNIVTVESFGRRWLKNMETNARQLPPVSPLPRSTGALVLAGSGPGLGDAIGTLRTLRHKFVLWALPSSLAALLRYGLQPDLVVSTDAGYWAARHLALLGSCKPVRVAAPLRAMLRPLWPLPKHQVSLFSMGLPFENELVAAMTGRLASRFLSLPDRGTVAVTALDLLESCHEGPVFSVGLDFAWRDLYGHVQPHTFSPATEARTRRTLPWGSEAYQSRESQPSVALATPGWRTMPPLTVYGSWLNQSRHPLKHRLIEYNPSGFDKGLPALPLKDWACALAESPQGISEHLEPAPLDDCSQRHHPTLAQLFDDSLSGFTQETWRHEPWDSLGAMTLGTEWRELRRGGHDPDKIVSKIRSALSNLTFPEGSAHGRS